jgi:trehalose synthase
MLETADVGTQDLNLYERSAGAEAVAQLQELAAPLEGARVLHVNATPYGGGVAEILRSEIPLLRDLGILADWKLITGDQTFFSVTEAIHNGLQGAPRELTPAEQETYLTHAARNAQLLEEEYDLVVVHDPQPLALLRLHGKGAARWVWRCHIDTSEPNPQVWGFLGLNLEGYDATVFTLGNFAPPDVLVERVEIIPQAIDPESSKHFEGAQQPRTSVAKVGLMGEERDPVCGTRIEPRQASEYVYREHRYHFCSESCCEQFRATPEYFLRAMSYRS